MKSLLGEQKVIRFLAAWKLVLLAVAIFVLATFPTLFHHGYFASNFHYPDDAMPSVVSMLATWDAQHFLYIAEHGYDNPDSNLTPGFFPLWPLVVRYVAPLLGGSYLAAALTLTTLFSFGAALIFYKTVRLRFDESMAWRSLVLWAVFPASFFLSLAYSEALFVLLAATLLLALIERRWWLVALMGVLLPVTRAVGVFAALPILFELFREKGWRTKLNIDQAAALVAPAIGALAYLGVMFAMTGDALAGIGAQAANVSGRSIWQLGNPLYMLAQLASIGSIHGPLDSAIDRLWFPLFLGALLVLWQRDRLFFWYTLGIGLPPVLTGFMSYTRYLVVVLPVFVAGALVADKLSRLQQRAVVGSLVVLQLLFITMHLNNHWVG